MYIIKDSQYSALLTWAREIPTKYGMDIINFLNELERKEESVGAPTVNQSTESKTKTKKK